MLASNIGQTNIESLNLVMPGHDYGWPIREGNFLINPEGDLNKIYRLPANDSKYSITYPIAEYDHDEGKSISGGYEYRGEALPHVKGKFLFGDILTGRLFFIDLKDLKDLQQGTLAPIKEWKIALQGVPLSLKEHFKNERVDLHLGRDASGELYLLTKTDGKIYRLSSATMTSTSSR